MDSISLFFQMPLIKDFNDQGKDGDENDRDDDEEEVVPNKRDVPKIVTAQHEKEDPGDPSDDIECDETFVGHYPDAGDKGCKGSNNGNKSGKDNRFPAIFLIEPMGAFKVFFVQETGVLPGEDLGAHDMTDPVIDRISRDGCKTEQDGKQTHIQGPQGNESPCGKEERISREKGSNDQTGFTEDDQEKERIRPDAVSPDDPVEVFVKMEQDIDEELKGFHRFPKRTQTDM